MTSSWTRGAVAGLVASALVGAQTFTSPAGHLGQEAPGNYFPLCALLPAVNQVAQVDNTLVGAARPGIHTLAWRRDGGMIPSSNFRAQTLDVAVRMAHVDWSRVQPGTAQDLSTLVVGGFTEVYARKTVALPDWTHPPATLPAAWDFRLPLDVAWDYDGQNALLWQMQIGVNQVGTETPVDYLGSGSWLAPRSVGTGCQVAGMPGPMTLYGQLLLGGDWKIAVENAPPSVPMTLALGLRDPNLDIGACALMRSSHDVVTSIGQSTATGQARWSLNIGYDPSFVGVSVWLQAFAPDANQGAVPYAFSQALEQVHPAPRTPPAGVALGRHNVFPPVWGWQNQLTLHAGRAIVTGMDAP